MKKSAVENSVIGSTGKAKEKTVLCFGSEGLGQEGDDVAFVVGKRLNGKLPGVRFIRCENPMDAAGYAGEKGLFMMDAVRGLDKVLLFQSIREFRKARSATAHDIDLLMVLNLLVETGKLGKVRIIGIPAGSNAAEAAEQVKRMLSRSQECRR